MCGRIFAVVSHGGAFPWSRRASPGPESTTGKEVRNREADLSSRGVVPDYLDHEGRLTPKGVALGPVQVA